MIRGKVDDAFLTNALTGSLDGEFYRQDKVTVLAGTMPPPNATDEIVLTQSMADAFRRQGVQFRVGDRMTWQLYRQNAELGRPRACRPGHVPDRSDRRRVASIGRPVR